MPEYAIVVVTDIREEVPGVKTFTVTFENGNNIPYTSGQFITLVFNHHGKEERRSFSISSCVDIGEPLSFTVKRVDNGAYSRYLTDRVKVSDKLMTTGVAGLFTFPELTPYDQVFFFAAGIGITPVLSLVKSALHTQPDKQLVLIYSNRVKEEVVFYNELRKLEETHKERFQLELLYSTSFNLMRARLNKELVPLLVEEYQKTPLGRTLFLVCGPYDYMRMVIYALEELNVTSAQIHKENFNTNNRHTPQAEPPDKDTHSVTIVQENNTYTYELAYPETILQLAKRHGISLPYSCEVGRCGSCAAMCTSGKVWLSYNEVLMDADLKKGVILTCVAHPVGGDVTIKVD